MGQVVVAPRRHVTRRGRLLPLSFVLPAAAFPAAAEEEDQDAVGPAFIPPRHTDRVCPATLQRNHDLFVSLPLMYEHGDDAYADEEWASYGTRKRRRLAEQFHKDEREKFLVAVESLGKAQWLEIPRERPFLREVPPARRWSGAREEGGGTFELVGVRPGPLLRQTYAGLEGVGNVVVSCHATELDKLSCRVGRERSIVVAAQASGLLLQLYDCLRGPVPAAGWDDCMLPS